MKLKKCNILENYTFNIHLIFFKRISIFGVFRVNHNERSMTSFFLLAIFGNSTHRRKKVMTYLESWGNFESEACAFMQNIDLKIWPFYLTLTWPPSKVNFDDVIGSNDHHYRYLRVKWLRKHVSHGMSVTFIF